MPSPTTAAMMLYFLSITLMGIIVFLLLFIWTRRPACVSAPPPESRNDYAELQECYELLLKSARRCARDLRHATQLIDQAQYGDIVKTLQSRYSHYETVLAGTNDYRIRLHDEIETLHQERQQLLSQLHKDTPTSSPL